MMIGKRRARVWIEFIRYVSRERSSTCFPFKTFILYIYNVALITQSNAGKVLILLLELGKRFCSWTIPLSVVSGRKERKKEGKAGDNFTQIATPMTGFRLVYPDAILRSTFFSFLHFNNP